MNIQALGEVAMVCLSAMKLREESYDNEADKYGLSLRQAAEASVATSMDGHPPEVKKATSELIHLMMTSWNDTEAWATSLVEHTVNININSQKETSDENTKHTSSPVRPDAELHEIE